MNKIAKPRCTEPCRRNYDSDLDDYDGQSSTVVGKAVVMRAFSTSNASTPVVQLQS